MSFPMLRGALALYDRNRLSKRRDDMNAKVDAYVGRSKKWPAEMSHLRPVLLASGLGEDIKWGKPCYSHDGANIAIIQEMNDFLALMFFKGALLSDPERVLESQGPNSRSALRITFRSTDDVKRLSKTIKAYVKEAITLEQAGAKVAPAPKLELVAELQARLASDPAFKAAFESLTPGRQREYNLHFSDAKQTATRVGRIDKFAPKILAGKGFRDA
jgi:uncharacterized protein YdeI (YjbR/CyaY-like superfamily)